MAKVITDLKKIESVLGRRIGEVMVRESIVAKLTSGRRLRIKLGADPSAPDLHLGHAVVLRKLREFQDLGHTIVFIIGDFTARIGDPSGKTKTRPPLSEKEIKKNAKTYFEQVKKILSEKNLEIRYNSEWFLKEGWSDALKLTSYFTVARILERDDFARRFTAHSDIGFHEMLYPVMQAHDSVKVSSDIEVGGTDQKFNLLAGRELQKKLGLPQQDIITVPLLVGTDGVQKMSKSLGNYIALLDKPLEMYGKVMSLPDSLIHDYLTLAADVPREEIERIEEELKKGLMNPRDAKSRLAKEIISRYHGKKFAEQAEAEFHKIFKEHKVPSEIPTVKMSPKPLNIMDMLVKTKLAPSKAQAKRLVEQGAVEVDGQAIKEWRLTVEPKKGMLIKVGKRGFAKIALA